MTEQEFLDAATAAALAVSRLSGFPPGITVAQAAEESNWGNSQLARAGHNYFGIKARNGQPSIKLPTSECIAGKTVAVTAAFARYASMEACFAARDRILATAACYAEARACRADPEAFARALARHWATDPAYAEKLLRLYRDHNLARLDAPAPNQVSFRA